MRYRIFLTVFILITGTGILRAQTTNITVGDFYKTFKGSQFGRMFDEKGDIKGSPYENDEFVTGEIYTNSLAQYTGIPLRYNIYSNQVEFKKPEGGIFEINPPDIIDSVLIGTSKYIFSPYKAASKTEKGYFKVLTDGVPLLLLKMNVILKPAEPAAPYKEPVPAMFKRTQDEFFLLFPSDEAVKFTSKKDFLEILNSFVSEMEQFINKNKIKFNRQSDVIKMVNYYSSLGK